MSGQCSGLRDATLNQICGLSIFCSEGFHRGAGFWVWFSGSILVVSGCRPEGHCTLFGEGLGFRI